jgi:hypothetical protein
MNWKPLNVIIWDREKLIKIFLYSNLLLCLKNGSFAIWSQYATDNNNQDHIKLLPLYNTKSVINRCNSFQMFVRLFVDENLDRCMPISKQPKEKVQAIIDSCTRQFPEFATRARKRIRTYLKSCRRTKRTREQAGLDMSDVSSKEY